MQTSRGMFTEDSTFDSITSVSTFDMLLASKSRSWDDRSTTGNVLVSITAEGERDRADLLGRQYKCRSRYCRLLLT